MNTRHSPSSSSAVTSLVTSWPTGTSLFAARAGIDADDIVMPYRKLGFTAVDEGLDLADVQTRRSARLIGIG